MKVQLKVAVAGVASAAAIIVAACGASTSGTGSSSTHGATGVAGGGPSSQVANEASSPTASVANSGGGGGSNTSTASEAPVLIGQTTALTGKFSAYGVPAKNAVELAIKQFNEQHECSQEVKLVSYDDQIDPQKSQTNMKKLLDDDKVDFVIAPAGSGPVLADLPLVNAANKIMINVTSQSGLIEASEAGEIYHNVFSFAEPVSVESQFSADYAMKLGAKRIALIGEATSYGQSGLDALTEYLKSKPGVSIVATETYQQGATDVTAQMLRIQQAKPDAVLAVSVGADTATIRKAMARLDMLNTTFIIPNGGGTLPYQNNAGKIVNGTYINNYKAYNAGTPADAAAEQFAKAYKAAYGNDDYYGPGEWPVPSFGLTPTSAYDGTSVLLQAFKEAGCSTDTSKVIGALESGTPFTGVRGEYTFSAAKVHNGVTAKDLVMDVYKATSNSDIQIVPASDAN